MLGQVNMTMDRDDCVMNMGVFMLDLIKYNLFKMEQRIKDLVVRHHVRSIWLKNTIRAPFILALTGHVQRYA
jgi:hypothetical protein